MSRGRYRCTTEVFNCSVGATNGHRSPAAVTLLNTLSSRKTNPIKEVRHIVKLSEIK